ncbi:type II secretion system protein M [Pseudomonas stutzeri]|nr:type II secretion system protein M [Stutzerimonas stutzeri]
MSGASLILRERCRRLGRPGALGAALLLFALAWGLFGLWPASRELDALQTRAATAREHAARVAAGVEAPPMQPGQQLASLQQSLPAQQEATAAIERIYAIAAREGIALARGDYALALDPQTRLARYRILLPLRGSYPQLRRFLAAIRSQLPALVLEDIDLQRKRISETELEGRIRMVLYLTR